jgi:hypothetical protein
MASTNTNTDTNGNGDTGFFDIADPDTFLGGQNVHNLIIIGLLGFLVFKSVKG